MTIISNLAKALVLNQELSALLVKGATMPVDLLSKPSGYHSKYFLVKKKEGKLNPVLDLRGFNRFMKVIPFHMLSTVEVFLAVA